MSEAEYQINQYRKTQLATLLTILGYEDMDDIKGGFKNKNTLFSLDEIGKFLESYKSFTSLESKTTEKPEDVLKEVKAQSEKYMQYLQDRREFIGKARKVYDGFGKDLQDKIMNRQGSLEDWENYSEVVQSTARLLISLNSDLFSKKKLSKCGAKKFVGLPQIEQEDRISYIIDSKQFTDACNTEHSIFIDETDNFERLLPSIQTEDDIYEFDRELLKERAQRANMLEKYKENYQNPNRVRQYPIDNDR